MQRSTVNKTVLRISVFFVRFNSILDLFEQNKHVTVTLVQEPTFIYFVSIFENSPLGHITPARAS